jgi:hypothetical protein
MNCTQGTDKQHEIMTKILAFINRSKGLKGSATTDGTFRIQQAIDSKFLDIAIWDLDGILMRSDVEGQEFVQVNFISGAKILITSNLIGFKPVLSHGLDLAKLPRVVTTPDIMSVFEAIQDTLQSSESDTSELTVLKKVYEAVLSGGEAVGFDLRAERAWASRISTNSPKLAS